MRIEVTQDTLTYELLRIAKASPIPNNDLAKRMGLEVLNITGTYGKRSDILYNILCAIGWHLEVADRLFVPIVSYDHVVGFAEQQDIMEYDLVKAGVYTKWARTRGEKTGVWNRTWFKALGKLGYKVYLCN